MIANLRESIGSPILSQKRRRDEAIRTHEVLQWRGDPAFEKIQGRFGTEQTRAANGWQYQ